MDDEGNEAGKVLFAWLTGRSRGRDVARRDSLNMVCTSDERRRKEQEEGRKMTKTTKKDCWSKKMRQS